MKYLIIATSNQLLAINNYKFPLRIIINRNARILSSNEIFLKKCGQNQIGNLATRCCTFWLKAALTSYISPTISHWEFNKTNDVIMGNLCSRSLKPKFNHIECESIFCFRMITFIKFMHAVQFLEINRC